MLHFAPTEEQEEIQKLSHSLAVDLLRARGREAESAGCVPDEVLRALFQTGLMTPFPEAVGGSGTLEAVTSILIAEELGFGDGAIAMNIVGSLAGALALALTGSEEQQRAYLAPLCDAQQGPVRAASLALAEQGGAYTLDEIWTTVSQQDDTLLLNGVKRGVIHGQQSRPRVILARLDGQPGPHHLCALLLPDEVHGLRVIPESQKLGLNAAPSATLLFEQARMGSEALLGEPGHPGVIRAATLYQLLRAGVALGSARAGLEYAADYARVRVAFGRPIVAYQGIAFLLAEMAMKLDAARLLLWHAAASWDRDADPSTLVEEAEAAQYQALTFAKAATIDTIQVLGGAGFIQDHPAEMWMRNTAALD